MFSRSTWSLGLRVLARLYLAHDLEGAFEDIFRDVLWEYERERELRHQENNLCQLSIIVDKVRYSLKSFRVSDFEK